MKQDLIDIPRKLRDSEAIDIEKLQKYLQEQLPDFEGEIVVEQFPSGHSNLTFLLKIGQQEVVLRRPPFGAKIKSAHDMGREYKTLSKLIEVYHKVPKPLLYCEDESVIGAPFYLMQRVRGLILRKEPPSGFESQAFKKISEDFIDNLVEIHSLEAARFGDTSRATGYVERQVKGWTERYQNAKTDDISDLEKASVWLAENLPPDTAPCLIHNDYKYDNLVLDPNNFSILAVLDWEMATIGNPLMDLGTSLGYWVEATDPEPLQQMRFCATNQPGNLKRVDLIERYASKSSKDVSDMLFYYVYALFKIAVIAQQIYLRYKQGFSKDDRFGQLINGIRVLASRAIRTIDKGHVE